MSIIKKIIDRVNQANTNFILIGLTLLGLSFVLMPRNGTGNDILFPFLLILGNYFVVRGFWLKGPVFKK